MEYIVIAILIAIIILMIVLHIYTIKSYEKRIGQYINRYMINDTHHNSTKNFLNLLLLETNGVNTGVKSRAALYRNFNEEVLQSSDVIKYDKDLVNEITKVKKKTTEKQNKK
jgi:hypothetical protein